MHALHRSFGAVLLSVLLASRCIPAQAAEFEVASIKPVDPNVPHMVGVKIYPGGRVVISAMSLKALTAIAFRLSYWQISGGDSWVEKDLYEIEAKPPESLRSGIKTLHYSNFGIEDESLRAMLQALLIDRFQLKFRRDTRTGDVWLLTRGTKPLALRPTEAPSADPNAFGSIGFAGGRWVLANTAMSQLAKFAADYVLRAPVVDRTDLAGAFDYKQPTRLADEEVNYSDTSEPFLRLIPELGLKLEKAKGPVEMFAIESAAKPSAN